MHFDHIVIHVDNDPSKFQTLTTNLNANGYPFHPEEGKRNREFSSSTVNIGDEYLEIVRILKPNAKTWMPLWTTNYYAGYRGAFCIFLEVEDAERLGANLKRAGVAARGPALLTYPAFFGLLRQDSPYYIYYMPNFPNSTLQLALISYKNKKLRDASFAGRSPNSASSGINAIRRVEIELPSLQESLSMLTKIFPDLHQETGEWITRLEKLRMVFRPSTNGQTNVRLCAVTSSRALAGNTLQIENVELATTGG